MTTPQPTLVHVLQQHAATFPDRRLYIYLADGESDAGSLTYGQLDEAARDLARVLLDTAAPGERAMLLYPVGLEYLVGLFGCLYAGIVAVPAYPLKAESRSGGRIQTMVADCRPRLALTSARMAPALDAAMRELGDASIRVLGTDDEAMRGAGGTFVPRVTPDTLAILQYTSASIAEAKGVRITHANVMANQEMIRHAMRHDDQSHFVSWLPPYHDMGLIGNLMQPLYLGASCVFMPPAAFVQKPLRWLQAISSWQARTSGAPNFAYDLCVRKIAPDTDDKLDLSRWTVAYCGAESIDARVFERFCTRFAPRGFRREAFYPCYGLAEATLMVTGHAPLTPTRMLDVDPDQLERGALRESTGGLRLVGCGTPPPEADVAIVDPATRFALADGAVGEIWARGAHIAEGYWNKPDASREVFDARIEGSDSGGYLRTGDLGVVSDGQLFVVGRIKELIIHQGRNVSPVDIERVAEAAAGAAIEACAAFAVHGDQTEQLAVVMETKQSALTTEAAQQLGDAIAWDVYRAFEVQPARLVFVKRGVIPRTSSGKKQRLLCSRLLTRGELEAIAEWRDCGWNASWDDAPGDEGAVWIASLIAKATGLSIDDVLHADSAGAWALDSLRAVEIAHRIERRTGVALPVSTFYDATSIEAIVKEIERASLPATSAHGGATEEGDAASAPMDVTPGQVAMWFSQQVAPDSPAFHLKWAMRCGQPLDPDRLRDAVRAVIARHEGLRSVFTLDSEGRVAARTLAAGLVDYAFLDGEDEALLEWANQECERPFQLDTDLLVRVRHGRGRRGDLVAFSLHHLIADLWSAALFTDEVLERYTTQASPERPTSYRPYARHVRERQADDASRRYWAARLDRAPRIDPIDVLLGDRPRPAVRTFDGATVSMTLDERTSRALVDTARRWRVSRQVLLLSLHGVSLWSLTHLDDFLTGCLTSGRSRASFARVHGLLANPFAVRFRLDAAATIAGVIASAREQVLGALGHEHYPFQRVVRDLGWPHELGRTPLFQNMFVYQQLPDTSRFAGCVVGAEEAPFVYRDLTMTCVPLPNRSARYDFTMYCAEAGERLVCDAVYDTALFERARVAEMLGTFGVLARRIAELPVESPLADVAGHSTPTR